MKKKVKKLALVAFSIFFGIAAAFSQTTIVGHVNYGNDNSKPIEDVNVYLNDSSGTIVDSTVTDSVGLYQFDSISDGIYTLNGTTNIEAGGIDLNDAFLISLYLLGYYDLDPIQLLAADVTGNGIVDWDDYWTIVIGWFIYGYPFPAGDWVFETPTITIVSNKTKDVDTTEMGGSSSGDVNGSFEPGTKPQLYTFLTNNKIVTSSPDQEIELPLKVLRNLQLQGIALSINYPEKLVKVEGIQTNAKGYNINITNNKINISWIDTTLQSIILNENDPLITLKLKTTDKFTYGKSLKFSLNPISNLIDSKGKVIKDITLSIPLVKSSGPSIVENTDISKNLSSIYPNPFNNITNINYNVPENGFVTIKIFDIQGREVNSLVNNYQNKGNYKILFNASNLNPGTYIYKINVKGIKNYSQSKMMIMSK